MAGSRSTRKGKPKGVYTEKRLAGIAPYNWKPGAPSPNPGGRPRQHREMVAKLRERADWIADAILALVEKGLEGKLTMSDKYLVPTPLGAMAGHVRQATCQSDVARRWPRRRRQSEPARQGGALPRSSAQYSPMGRAAKRLLRRRRRPPDHPALTPEERAISPAAVMLAKVRADNDGRRRSATAREILAELARRGARRRTDRRGRDRGRCRRRRRRPPRRQPPPGRTPRGRGGRNPPPPRLLPPRKLRRRKPRHRRQAATVYAAAGATRRPSARQPRRPTGFPEFDRFSAEKADQERAKKVEAARAQGRCQIGPEEAFPPDPREPPEVVRFTLAPGGRIRRVAG